MKDYSKALKGGAVYIKDGDYKQMQCIGFRDLANEMSVNESTSFPTASAGKVFVAVGILKLVEKNILSLETTLGELVDFQLHSIDQEVTVYQLLTHTSGVPDYFDETVMDDYSDLWKNFPNYKIRTSKDLLPLFVDKPMAYPKGERFAYNDSGFVMLGLIIEAVTEKPFDEYLSEVLFKPLDMSNTGYYELDRLPSNCANAYIYDEKKETYYMNIYSVDVKGTGAGGAFTSALDIQKFWDGLLGGKLLKEETLSSMLERHVDLGDHGYGLGIWLDAYNLPYFQGVDPGVTCMSWCHPGKRQFITIMSNYQDDVFTLCDELKKALL